MILRMRVWQFRFISTDIPGSSDVDSSFVGQSEFDFGYAHEALSLLRIHTGCVYT